MNFVISILRLITLVANGLLAVMTTLVILRAKEDDMRNFYIALSFALLNIFTIMALSSSC